MKKRKMTRSPVKSSVLVVRLDAESQQLWQRRPSCDGSV
jgi:hypothetical protein